MKLFLVGRHSAQVGDHSVVGSASVQFPPTAEGCLAEMAKVYVAARAAGADAVALQAVPGQLAAALAYESRLNGETGVSTPVYAVISKPGPRPGKVSKEFQFTSEHDNSDVGSSAITFANPNAKVTALPSGRMVVEVDGPPMPFAFSHLERVL